MQTFLLTVHVKLGAKNVILILFKISNIGGISYSLAPIGMVMNYRNFLLNISIPILGYKNHIIIIQFIL